MKLECKYKSHILSVKIFFSHFELTSPPSVSQLPHALGWPLPSPPLSEGDMIFEQPLSMQMCLLFSSIMDEVSLAPFWDKTWETLGILMVVVIAVNHLMYFFPLTVRVWCTNANILSGSQSVWIIRHSQNPIFPYSGSLGNLTKLL